MLSVQRRANSLHLALQVFMKYTYVHVRINFVVHYGTFLDKKDSSNPGRLTEGLSEILGAEITAQLLAVLTKEVGL